MGVIIACYSTWHGRGNTTNAISLAVNIAMNYDAKVLLMHSQYKRSNLEEAFYLGDEDIDSGIDSLERYALTGEFNGINMFESYCNNKIPERLDLLVGSKKVSRSLFYEGIGKNIVRILNCAKDTYDVVVIDVNSGTNINDGITNKVLEIADSVIVTIDQTEKLLEEFFTKDITKIPNKKLKLVLGKYDSESKCSKLYVKKMFKYFDEIFSIPYSTDVMDSINNHDILKFFYANRNISRKNSINVFFNELNLLTDNIISTCNVSLSKSQLKGNAFLLILKKIFKVS